MPDALSMLGVICVCVIFGCALVLPFLRLVLAPIMRTWRCMTPFARIAIAPVVVLATNFAASKPGGTNAPPNGAVKFPLKVDTSFLGCVA